MSKACRLVRAAILLAVFAVSCPAWASYVTTEGVNCRSRPDVGARVVAKLFKGQSVSISEAGDGWSKLDRPYCWVSSRFLASEYVGAIRSYPQTARGTGSARSPGFSAPRSYSFSSAAKKSRKKSSAKQLSGRGGSYGGSSGCPCSGGTVCIGPRGGRYCITSGGNKRYGV
ncbi:SH3 domain-containing protein [Sphingobium sp. JS3065]|uniref:SH3 domain-containing protein n=1 Tax=Sphingobium sp. JS3065 TaxID=2970925 RepID=UPI003A5B9711